MARLPLSLFILLVLTAVPAAPAIAQTAPGDFDDDGYSDLAIGIPTDGRLDNGNVPILYGSGGGLSGERQQLWSRSYADYWLEEGERPNFGYALATGDFNGDGFADLAGGAPGTDVGSTEETWRTDTGAVTVLYGGTEGLSIDDVQIWDQDDPGVEGEAQPGDGFGTALATGDFNGDGFDDLAIGVQDDVVDGVRSGAVSVLYGSSSGLTPAGNQLWHQDAPGLDTAPDEDNESGDRFGGAVAAGDFDEDGFDDLAIGAPREDNGMKENVGKVTVLYGGASGLQTERAILLAQHADTGGPEKRDYYGSSLAVGDFDEGPGADLAIGAPGEDFGKRRNAGGVAIIYSPVAVCDCPREFWHQGVGGLGGHSEAGDEFGSSLAAADFGHGLQDDLAVGVPGENSDAGAVNVIFGRPSGLSGAGDERWHQDRGGVPGSGARSDRFGSSLAAADFGQSSRADLAIGVPYDAVGDLPEAGAVNVLYGRSGGLTGTGSQRWHQDSPGVRAPAEARDHFGFALAPAGSNPFSPHFSFPFG